MAVITISRQLGSFGSVIAHLVAEDLGFHLLDREIVDLVAARAHVTAAIADGVDERAFRGASGLFYSLLVGIQNGRLTPESYVYFATQVIREAASRCRPWMPVLLAPAWPPIFSRSTLVEGVLPASSA